mgnify:FL=1
MHTKNKKEILRAYSTDENAGLTSAKVLLNARYGKNVIKKPKETSVFKKVLSALLEPMMLILVFALMLTAGVNIGKFLKTGDGDFYECIGILLAISVSVAVTVIMEDKSKKALEFLTLAGGGKATVIRDGKKRKIAAEEIVVGDIVCLEAGDKVYADGRIIYAEDLRTDESILTGESKTVKKDPDKILRSNAPLAERVNCAYSGTFVTAGRGVMVVAAVGDKTETGLIAKESNAEKNVSAPLNAKLSRLGKTVSIFGGVASAAVFVLSLIRLAASSNFTFDGVTEAFIQSVLLIVAAVPEGLPATVAISLTLNVVRLAKSNALIKKLVAAETIGGVSLVCSDKTGTLTANDMVLEGFYDEKGKRVSPDRYAIENFALNTTATVDGDKKIGSATELALVSSLEKFGADYKKFRASKPVASRVPFSSDKKYMTTTVKHGNDEITYLKGSPEAVSKIVGESGFLTDVSYAERRGMRVLAFAHKEKGKWFYDGFAAICDDLRPDAKEAVETCLKAGVKVKILTGDSKETAAFIAEKLSLKGRVAENAEIEAMSDDMLAAFLKNVSVVARSTPKTKLRIVEALQKNGEVVAVTGDGVNDAPAIRHSDIGIAMGSGSDVTKEAADLILLDDKFSTIVKAVAFGRGVFGNFRRFISFQLTVNLASMSIIVASLLTGLDCPFTSTSLLWLNVIMDGPLALSLGVEDRKTELEKTKPVRRDEDVLTPFMMARIGLTSVFMCAVTTCQQLFNFLGANINAQPTVVLSVFVFIQLFNAINCAAGGSESSIKRFFGNKLLVIMLFVTLSVHILVCQFIPSFFGTVPLEPLLWLKIFAVCSSVLVVSELFKLAFALIKKKAKNKRIFMTKRRSVT